MPQSVPIPDGTWLLIAVPALLVIVNITFKVIHKADPFFAGADLALCACSVLLTWLARAMAHGTLPPGEGLWALMYTISSFLLWFVCLKVATLRRYVSLFGTAVVGGSLLFLSSRYIYHLTQRGF